MDADEMTSYICATFTGVEVATGSGDRFFYRPGGAAAGYQRMPFATIVAGDHYDGVSHLDEPGAYRLNIGVPEHRYKALFGALPTRWDERGVLVTGADYAARDTLLPHPIYAEQGWVCVVNPGAATWDLVRDLLAEAYLGG
jgi:hypothetical protein